MHVGSGGNCYRSNAAGPHALLYLGIIREGGSSVEGLIRAECLTLKNSMSGRKQFGLLT